ncbi:MAG: PBP1A family penicillin-binding protein [Chloroflexi bacterium]|nr:PBP1A family penicillin-binding protein [Chloroflexota bacterium]
MTRIGRLVAAILLLGTAITTGWGTALAFGVVREFNDALASSDLTAGRMPLSTQIFDRHGRLLHEVFSDTRRTYLHLGDAAPFLIQATIATEDASFYQNWGVSPRGVARALWNNLFHPDDLQGGSTITQQLIKNTIIPEAERYERSGERKLKEALLAVLLTSRYPKEQILEWYLNQVFYGNNSYGMEAAAQAYFGKSARDLTLAEAAMLAGLPQAPASYDPYTRPDQAKARQETVLGLMVRHGYITEDQAQAAAGESLDFRPRRFAMEAPHFVMHIREALEARYGPDALYRGGLQVTTSLDLDLQRQAEAIIREKVDSPAYQQSKARNAALVALRPGTGEVLALVGSADFENDAISGQINMALAERQPGSTFKPITYVTAFMKGWNPATRVEDKRTPFPDGRGGQWIPKSADGKYRGWVSVRQALAMSLNVPAVLALQHAGLPQTLDTAHRMGITTLLRNDYGLALTLGGGEVKLFDLAYAYTVFANNGMQSGQPRPATQLRPGMRELDPVVIRKVAAPNGRVLEEFTEPQQRQVLPAPHAYLITDILVDGAARAAFFGRNSPLDLPDRPVAVKTGTTDDARDVWTVGYTPDLVVGVWVGNTDYTPMVNAYGSSTAGPIWNAFMTAALRDSPPAAFVMPPGLVRAPICQSTGAPPSRRTCSDLREEIFVQGAVPTPRSQPQVAQIEEALKEIEDLLAQGQTVRARRQLGELRKEIEDLQRAGKLGSDLTKELLARLTVLDGRGTPTATPARTGTPQPSGTPTRATTPQPTATPARTGTPQAAATPTTTATAPDPSPTPATTLTPSPTPTPSAARSGTATGARNNVQSHRQ